MSAGNRPVPKRGIMPAFPVFFCRKGSYQQKLLSFCVIEWVDRGPQVHPSVALCLHKPLHGTKTPAFPEEVFVEKLIGVY